MFSRSRGLPAVALTAAVLVTLSACDSDTAKDSNTGASASRVPRAPRASATATGTGQAEAGPGRPRSLPAANSGVMKLAASGKDVTSGFPTVFYETTAGTGADALNDYLFVLRRSGYSVSPDGQFYRATKQGVELALGANQPVSMQGLVTVQVVRGSGVTLPHSPSSGGLERRLPGPGAQQGNDAFLAAGSTQLSATVFYRVDSVGGFLASLRNDGYTVSPAMQDGERFPNLYRAVRSGHDLTVEVVTTSVAGGLGIVTVVD